MRRATIRTRHDDPATVAAAVAPDNTAEMTTRVDENIVETIIERATTGGLRTSLDDYLVNLSVAERTRTDTTIDTHTSTNNTKNDNE